MRIVITGGHLTPAIAVIKKLQQSAGWKILFIGRKQTTEGDQSLSVEFQTISQLGVNFVNINAGRLQRWPTRYSLISFLKIPLGFFQSLFYLFRFRPDVILSFGSYVALPVVLSGWLLRIPVITHEQSFSPGLANRLIAPLSKKIAISWPETARFFPAKKVVLTGNPLRPEILSISYKQSAIRHLPAIYITGGSQGAHALNEVVRKALPTLLRKYQLIHQCGPLTRYQDYQKLKAQSEKLKTVLKKRYQLKKWFSSKETADILGQVDLVVSRAGANIITELAFLNKPALLIPLSFGREQQENADRIAQTGLVKILSEEKLTPKSFLTAIKEMMENLGEYQKKGQKAKKMIHSQAAGKLIAEVKKCGH